MAGGPEVGEFGVYVDGDGARKLGNTNVNLTTAYLATNTRLVLAADNLAAAKSALG